MSGATRFCVCWVLLSAALSACSTTAVKAWERGQLATPEMAWDLDPGLNRYREHAQFSKEAASGQIGQAGGGCGCN